MIKERKIREINPLNSVHLLGHMLANVWASRTRVDLSWPNAVRPCRIGLCLIAIIGADGLHDRVAGKTKWSSLRSDQQVPCENLVTCALQHVFAKVGLDNAYSKPSRPRIKPNLMKAKARATETNSVDQTKERKRAVLSKSRVWWQVSRWFNHPSIRVGDAPKSAKAPSTWRSRASITLTAAVPISRLTSMTVNEKSVRVAMSPIPADVAPTVIFATGEPAMRFGSSPYGNMTWDRFAEPGHVDRLDVGIPPTAWPIKGQ